MTTISDAQASLSRALDKIQLPEDMSDWDMEDWTIFALSYLQANLDDALEGQLEDEEFMQSDKTSENWKFFAESPNGVQDFHGPFSSLQDALDMQKALKLNGYSNFSDPEKKDESSE